MPIRLLPLVFATLFMASAHAAAPPPDAPLVVDKSVKVDVLDIEASMLRLPPEKRPDFLTVYDRIAGVVDQVFIARSFAEKARALGLDKDPRVQRRMQQVEEEVLAAAYGEKLEAEVNATDLEQRAREIYVAERDKMKAPEVVAVQHILVDFKGRTRDMARKRADEVYAKAKAGEDFLALADQYSDDPDKPRNRGDLGYLQPLRFAPPVRSQIATMKVKGELSAPIETESGYDIVRFVDRKPEQAVPFEAAKKTIIAMERERLKKQKFDQAILEIRSSPTAVGYRENLEALVVPIDPQVLKEGLKAQDEVAKSLEAQKKGK